MNVLPVLFRKNDSLDISASDVGSLGRLPVSAFLPNSHLLTWSWLTTRHSYILVLVQVLVEYLEIIETLFKAFYYYGLSENEAYPNPFLPEWFVSSG